MSHSELFLQNSVCRTLAQEDSVAPASVSTELSLSHSGSGRQCCTCFCFYRTQFVALWLRKTVLHLLLFLQNSVCHTLAQEYSVAPASVSTELSLSHSGSGRQCCICFCFYRTQFVTLWLRKTVLHLLLFLQNSVCHTLAQEDSVAPASVSTELSLSHSGSGRQCCICFCFYRTQFVTLWLMKTVLHLLLFLQNSVCHTLAQEDSVAPASVSTELSLSHSGSGRQCCTCFCFYRTQFVTLWLGKTVLHLLLFLHKSVCHTLAWEDSVAPASVSTELGLSHSGSGIQCCTCFCFYRTQFVALWLRKTVLHLLLFLQNSVCHTLAWEDSVAPASVSTELSLSHSGSGRQCCICFCFVIYTTHILHHQQVAMPVRIIIMKTSSQFLRTLYLIAQSSIRPGLSISSLVNLIYGGHLQVLEGNLWYFVVHAYTKCMFNTGQNVLMECILRNWITCDGLYPTHICAEDVKQMAFEKLFEILNHWQIIDP